MPIPKKWSRFNKENVRKVPKEHGVYEIANSKKAIIDQGGSDAKTGMRGRLSQRLRVKKPPTGKHFRFQTAGLFQTGIGLEAAHAEKYKKQHHGRKPPHTKRSPKKRGLF
jgi:hypothetical protein